MSTAPTIEVIDRAFINVLSSSNLLEAALMFPDRADLRTDERIRFIRASLYEAADLLAFLESNQVECEGVS